MKTEKIYFERTKSLPGYNNIKVGIQLSVDENEKAVDVLRKAEIFVDHALNESPSPQQMELAINMVNHKKEIDELPF